MINLLSSQYKKELENIKKYKIILILEILFIFFLISLLLFLFLIKTYIKEKITEIDLFKTKKEVFQTLDLKNKELKQKLKPINKTLSDLSIFYSNQINIIETIKDLPTPPPDISLNAFSFDKNTSFFTITIFGNALTRESLIQFKNFLEEKKEFSEVYIPWSDLLKTENIDFTIIFKKYPKK